MDAVLSGSSASALNFAHNQNVKWYDFPNLMGLKWYGAQDGVIGQVLTITQIKRLVPNSGDRGIIGGLRIGQSGSSANLDSEFTGFLFMKAN